MSNATDIKYRIDGLVSFKPFVMHIFAVEDMVLDIP